MLGTLNQISTLSIIHDLAIRERETWTFGTNRLGIDEPLGAELSLRTRIRGIVDDRTVVVGLVNR